jgi:hypothetical protein
MSSKTLYPGTRLIVTRVKKNDYDYTDEVEVEVDYKNVDPRLTDPHYGESKANFRKRVEDI